MKYREIVAAYNGLKTLSDKEIGFNASKAVGKNMEILQTYMEKYINFRKETIKKYASLSPESPEPETYKFNDVKSRLEYNDEEMTFLDQSVEVMCMLPEDLVKDLKFMTPNLYLQLKPILA